MQNFKAQQYELQKQDDMTEGSLIKKIKKNFDYSTPQTKTDWTL